MDEREIDALLVAQVRAGDLAAFERLVRKYQRRIYRLALGVVGQPGDAEDVTQETFIQAFRSIEAFRGDAAFFTWLYQIGLHKALTWRKRMRQRAVLVDDGGPAAPEEEALEGGRWEIHSPAFVLENKQALAAIDAILATMSPPFVDALLMFVCDGMACRDIAVLAGVDQKTVRSRIFRAREILSDQLDDSVTEAAERRRAKHKIT